MNKLLYISIISICLIFLTTCTKQELPDEIINIEEEFNIDIVEQLGGLSRSLIFNVSTIETFNCLNYTLDCSSENGPSYSTLYLEEIIEPENCSVGIAPANCQSLLMPTAIGEQPFRIVIKEGVINEGKIIKSATSYSIALESQHGIGSYTNALNIIPDDFIWATIATDNFNQSVAIDMILTDFVKDQERPYLEDGYYGYFSMNNQELELKEVQEGTYQNTYFFNLKEGELLENLKEKSEALRTQFGEVRLDLYTSTGIKF